MAYMDKCPACGDKLEVVGGTFEAQGLILQKDGFCTMDADCFNTSDELVVCRNSECKKHFGLEELFVEEIS